MFNTFYSLKENPFNITADPDFYFGSKSHDDAISHLEFGLQSRKGIMVLTGEVGTGKTTLCRLLINQLSQNILTAFILNPSFSQLQLLQLIAQDLGIQKKISNKLALVNTINEFLLKNVSRGFNVAVIIDEAQNLTTNQLEQVRLLSNLETNKHKLLQIILVGQPELISKLNQPALRQLSQRVVIKHTLSPLNHAETNQYIHHRLTIAEASDKLVFEPEAIDRIFDYSQGIPRIINVLSERALLAGFAQETFTITKEIVTLAAEETGYSTLQGVTL